MVSLKPNDKLTFPVLDKIHPFLLLTALFKYLNFGHKEDKFLLRDFSKIWQACAEVLKKRHDLNIDFTHFSFPERLLFHYLIINIGKKINKKHFFKYHTGLKSTLLLSK